MTTDEILKELEGVPGVEKVATRRHITAIQRILGELTEDEQDELRTHVEVAAEGSQLSESTVWNGCFELAFKGMNRKDIQQSIHPIAEYADHWKCGITKVASYASDILTVYGFGPVDVDEFLGVTDDAIVGCCVTASEIATASKYAAPIAAEIDYPFEQLIGDIAQKIHEGRQETKAGVDLRERYRTAGEVIASIEGEDDE